MIEMSAPNVLKPDTRDVAILMPVRKFAGARGTGEYIFCNGLRDVFKTMGRHSYVVPYVDWNTPRPNTIDFSFVRKDHSYISRPDVAAVAWLVYGVADIDVPALEHCAHVLAASPKIAQAVKADLPGMDVTVMPQSCHGATMTPDGPATPGGIVYVANQHTKTLRTGGAMAHAAGLPVEIYGRRWEGTPLEGSVRETRMFGPRVSEIYRGADAVLNDHIAILREDQSLSNRVFDVLACGRPLLSDPIGWCPDDIADFIGWYTDPESLRTAAEAAQGEDETRRAERRDLARHIHETYSFETVARHVLSVV